jgi:polar amino acid transport system substrate-binding protein
MTENKLKVVVAQSSPFVTESNGVYSGFEIELWEEIAKQIGMDYEYEEHPFHELIPLIVDKKADVALGAITIKEEREKIIDFSHKIFDSGLHILLSKDRAKINFTETLRAFFSQGYTFIIKPLLWLIVILVIFANAVWIAERNGGSISPMYFPGVFQTFWLSCMAIIGSYVDIAVFETGTWAGRIIILIGQIFNIALFGFVVAEMTAFITTRKIRMNIEGPRDLRRKRVATEEGSTSESALKELGAIVVPVDTIEEAYEKLKKNEVRAVVFDAPVLTHYAMNEGREWAEIVGDVFDRQNYGVVVQEESYLREKINRAILALYESGFYAELYKKYFEEA